MRLTTKVAARGKWDGIIVQLIGEHAVSRKHGPCPICAGKDRYRYDNKRNDGDWFCNVCGVGDGFKLLQDALGISFAEAARQVDRIVNNIEAVPFKPVIDTEQRRNKLNALWAEGDKPFVAWEYLKKRGINGGLLEDACDIRGHPRLALYDGTVKLGDYPAMLALIRNAKGEPVSIHRTYIMPDGSKQKKIMPPIETITGGCIRLAEPQTSLAFAEGIETALAMWQLSGIPCWATISAHGMTQIKSIPKQITHVYLCADNDLSFVGQAAAFEAAKYMKQKFHIKAEVWMPTLDEMDMLDFLNSKRNLEMLKWRGR